MYSSWCQRCSSLGGSHNLDSLFKRSCIRWWMECGALMAEKMSHVAFHLSSSYIKNSDHILIMTLGLTELLPKRWICILIPAESCSAFQVPLKCHCFFTMFLVSKEKKRGKDQVKSHVRRKKGQLCGNPSYVNCKQRHRERNYWVLNKIEVHCDAAVGQ